MSDGHGCDAGGHGCGEASANSGVGDGGFAIGTDGRTPVPNIKRLTLNGAPIIENSHEYVIDVPQKRLDR